jgi:hypothetical protein
MTPEGGRSRVDKPRHCGSKAAGCSILGMSIFCGVAATIYKLMNRKLLSHSLIILALPWTLAMFGQDSGRQYSAQGSPASASQGGAVSYATVSQVNGLLAQLEATSKATQADLTKLRIEKWKADGSSKKQALADMESIQRNLQNALPEMIGQVRNSPGDLPATFKLYRNLDALYDVMGGVVESAGAFGPKDDFQSLSNDLSSFEGTRRQLAERIDTLATSKEQEIVRLRTDLRTAQAAVEAAPPKKIVVDDNEPVKKPPAKRKPVAKKPAATAPGTSGATPAQSAPAQTKPQ